MADKMVNVTVPGEVAAAFMTQRPELLGPLMARLQEGEVLPQGQVIALVNLLGDQLERFHKLKVELDEIGHAVESLNQAEKHMDKASERLKEQLEVTTNLLLEMDARSKKP
jgi:hypothetical protein